LITGLSQEPRTMADSKQTPNKRQLMTHRTRLFLLSCLTLPLTAQEVLPKTAETFEVDGHKAFVYAAPTPADGKPLR